MGNECKSICDNVANNRNTLVSELRDEKTNGQLAIYEKSKNAVPEEYFSREAREVMGELKANDVIPC